MDPVGTIVALAEVTAKVAELVASYHESTGRLKNLRAEVRVFEATIQHINTWLRSTDSIDRESILSGLGEALDQVKEVLLGLESELNRVSGELDASMSPRVGRWQKAKYVWSESFFENCSKELHRWGSLLQLSLSASQL